MPSDDGSIRLIVALADWEGRRWDMEVSVSKTAALGHPDGMHGAVLHHGNRALESVLAAFEATGEMNNAADA